MSALQNNVDALRAQLAKQEVILEQQKNTAKEKEERSWKFNIGVLEETAKDKGFSAAAAARRRGNNHYSKAYFVAADQDREIAPFMKSCVNCFKRLDESMSHIENVITTMDERLTHIERFLTDDIQKEEFLKNSSQNKRCQTVEEALDVADTWTKAVKEEIDKRVQNKLGDNHMPPEPWYDSI